MDSWASASDREKFRAAVIALHADVRTRLSDRWELFALEPGSDRPIGDNPSARRVIKVQKLMGDDTVVVVTGNGLSMAPHDDESIVETILVWAEQAQQAVMHEVAGPWPELYRGGHYAGTLEPFVHGEAVGWGLRGEYFAPFGALASNTVPDYRP